MLDGAAGALKTQPHPQGPENCFLDYWPARAADAAAESARAAGPFRDYISIPLVSPGKNTFPPAFQVALVGISDPAFSYLSDLLYVPTI